MFCVISLLCLRCFFLINDLETCTAYLHWLVNYFWWWIILSAIWYRCLSDEHLKSSSTKMVEMVNFKTLLLKRVPSFKKNELIISYCYITTNFKSVVNEHYQIIIYSKIIWKEENHGHFCLLYFGLVSVSEKGLVQELIK